MAKFKLNLFAILAMLLLISPSVVAEEGAVSVETMRVETPELFLIGDTRITFETDGISVTDGKNAKSFKYSEINKIYIDWNSDVVGVEDAQTNIAEIMKLVVCSNTLNIKGWEIGNVANLRIYDTEGRICLSVKDWSGDPVDVSQLESGYYVVNVNQFSAKFYKL